MGDNTIKTLYLAVQGGSNTRVIEVTDKYWMRVAKLADWSAVVIGGNIQLHLGVGSRPVTLSVGGEAYCNVISYEFKAFASKSKASSWLKS